jgi:phospholipase/lecithinase/hemolysin
LHQAAHADVQSGPDPGRSFSSAIGRRRDSGLILTRVARWQHHRDFPRAAIAVATFSFAAGPAGARPFDRLWVFGDSTVDTGWYNFLPSGESQFDQYLSNYNLARPRNVPPTYDMGKATSNPGPISVEVLARLIATEVLPADQVIMPVVLPLVVPEVVSSGRGLMIPLPRPLGTNYATGGARNHDVNPPGSNLFPNAVPTETQIANYLGEFTPDGRALYVISSGGNDVFYAVKFLLDDPTAAAAYVIGAAEKAQISVIGPMLPSPNTLGHGRCLRVS